MAEPLWFLDNMEEGSSKTEQSSLLGNERAGQASDSKTWSVEDSTPSSPGASKQNNNQEINWNADDSSVGGNGKEASQDENNLRLELGNSLIDFAKDSIEKGKPTQFQITINSDDIQASSVGEQTIAVDNSLSGDQGYTVESDKTADKIPKIVLTLSTKENGQTVGGDKTIKTENFLGEDENLNEDNKEKPRQPTIYVILKSNKNENLSGDNEFQLNSPDSNNQYCTEIGSTVINLNDLINSENKQVSANNDISVTQGSSGDGKSKVELVITIKDKRKKPSYSDAQQTSNSYAFSEEQDFLQGYHKQPIREESLDSQLKRIRGRIQNISNDLNSTAQTWQTTKYSKPANRSFQNDQWSSESRDSFVRESDGARCYRTVWTTPGGRKVQTQCYKEGSTPRQKRDYGRARNYDWSSDFGSLWRGVNDDFNRLFTRANRYMYF